MLIDADKTFQNQISLWSFKRFSNSRGRTGGQDESNGIIFAILGCDRTGK